MDGASGLELERGGAGGARPAAGARVKARSRTTGGDEGPELVCSRCGHVITRAGARVEIDGLHEYTQVNPHGAVWRFRCFARAPGCQPAGPPSSEFTWFAGHTWQIALCGRCQLHLGWAFRGPERRFHGLIADRLVERNPGA